MLSMLNNLTKAAVAVAAAPVAVVADILTLPATSLDPRRGPFDKTAGVLKQASDAFDAAVKPEKTE